MKIDLQKFCAENDIRSYLEKPFAVDGHTVATNGRIAVRVPGVEEGTAEASEQLAAAVRKMFSRTHADFVPMPGLPERVECDHCHGTGQLDEDDCDDCDGAGEFTHGNHIYTCEECDGTGRVNGPVICLKCGGTGEPFTVVKVGEVTFQAKYLRLIADLPGARINLNDDWPDPTAFIFDGGDGRIVKCRE